MYSQPTLDIESLEDFRGFGVRRMMVGLRASSLAEVDDSSPEE